MYQQVVTGDSVNVSLTLNYVKVNHFSLSNLFGQSYDGTVMFM